MRLLAPAAAAVLLLALTGCSEPEPGSPMPTGPAPVTSPQPTATASATTASPTQSSPTGEATETPTPVPTLPPEATTNDAAGAEAFVRYWFQTLTYALATGDEESLAAISHPDCSLCNSYLDEINQRSTVDASVSGGRFDIKEAVAPAPDGSQSTFVAIVYERDAGAVVDREGAVIETLDAERDSVDAVLAREGNAWVLYGFGV